MMVKDDNMKYYPLSSVQREIWFDQKLYPETPMYNIGGYNRISGSIDPALFRQAITLLVQETEILRMALTEHDGVPLQYFPAIGDVEVIFIDRSKDADPLQIALSEMHKGINQPFRILEELLFRHTLYKLSEDSYLWFHIYHHLVVDGWAYYLITERIAELYSALLKHAGFAIRSGNPYLDFVEDDSVYLESVSFERHRHYWQQKLSPLPEQLLSPRAGYSNRTDVVPGAVYTSFLPRYKYVQLVTLAQSYSVSIFHLLLGLLYVYFTRVLDKGECVIGIPVLNRTGKSFKQTIGLFASVIPARLSFGHEVSFIELMQGIAIKLRESYRSQRFPLSETYRVTEVYKAGRKRLFDISLSFDKHNYAACFGSGRICETIAINHEYEQLPLSLFVRDYSETQDVQFDFSYNLTYFDNDAMERIQGQQPQHAEHEARFVPAQVDHGG